MIPGQSRLELPRDLPCTHFAGTTALLVARPRPWCSAPPRSPKRRPTSQTPLEEIVVTATLLERTLDKTPAAVSVVTEDDIQLARQQLALDESLSRVPGLFMQNRYNFAQDLRLSIRGFGARGQFGIRGVKVLVDGIPETLPDGLGSVDSIDLGATSQIEVIRGPSSALYGNASGGVISLTSEGGRDVPYARAARRGGRLRLREVAAEVRRRDRTPQLPRQRLGPGARRLPRAEHVREQAADGPVRRRPRQGPQPADRRQLHRSTGVRRPRRPHGGRRAASIRARRHR